MKVSSRLLGQLIATLALAMLEVGCPTTRWPRVPVIVPFSLAEKGFTVTTDFAAVDRLYLYLFSLDLVLEKNYEEEYHRVAKLWGGPSSFDRETSEFKPVGIPIPLRLIVSRVEGNAESVVYDQAFSQLASWAGSRTQLSKLIAYVKLQPGHYRVQLVALEAVPELAATKVNLSILIQHNDTASTGRGHMNNESYETSEYGRVTLVLSRFFSTLILAGFGFVFWDDRTFIDFSRSGGAAFECFLAVAALIGLSWWLLGVLMRSSKRSLSFDDDGVWRAHLGKAQGLVRWSDVYRVKEGTSALALFDGAGQLLLKVEYERESYFKIRQRIMEGMAFQAPVLPFDASLPGAKVSGSVRLAFACAALFFVGGSALAIFSAQAPVWVTVLLCAAVLCGLSAFPRLKVIVGIEGIQVRKKTCPFSDIRSVDASFMSLVYGQNSPKLTLQVREGRPVVILTRGLGIDSLTLQRILLRAVGRPVLPTSSGA